MAEVGATAVSTFWLAASWPHFSYGKIQEWRVLLFRQSLFNACVFRTFQLTLRMNLKAAVRKDFVLYRYLNILSESSENEKKICIDIALHGTSTVARELISFAAFQTSRVKPSEANTSYVDPNNNINTRISDFIYYPCLLLFLFFILVWNSFSWLYILIMYCVLEAILLVPRYIFTFLIIMVHINVCQSCLWWCNALIQFCCTTVFLVVDHPD